METSLRVARAAYALAALLFVLALAGPDEPPPACTAPREAEAQAGRTTLVDCRPGARGGPVRGPARLLFGLGLDPNRADVETLAALPGIGPARAAAIVAGRAGGPYRTPRDLLRVHGIGPKTVERLRPFLYFPERGAGLQENG
jgi:competence ComEA-like helix-hairpin-helix protein